MGGHINQYPRKELIEPNTKVNQAYFYEKAPSKTSGLNPSRKIHDDHTKIGELIFTHMLPSRIKDIGPSKIHFLCKKWATIQSKLL